jgi:beta-barrel assembly-enhancing protease
MPLRSESVPGSTRRVALRLAFGSLAAMAFSSSARAQTLIADHAAVVKPKDIGSDEGSFWALLDRDEADLRRSAFVIHDPGLIGYLRQVACKVGGAHCEGLRIYALRNPEFNASIALNGVLQIWSGLLLRMDNEAQLAAILGHELGHYVRRNGIVRFKDAKTRSGAAAAMGMVPLLGLIGGLATMSAGASVYRSHEFEADALSLRSLRGSGYDTREAAKVWSNLRAELAVDANRHASSQSAMFATHPGMEDRQAKLTDQAKDDAGGFVGAEVYQAQLEPLMHDLLQDELGRRRFDETIVLMTRLSALRPERSDLIATRGEAFRIRGKPDDAASAWTDYLAATQREEPSPIAWRGIGLLNRSWRRRADAVHAFQKYLALAPTAPDAALIDSYIKEMTI